MVLNSDLIPAREKVILSGLYFARYDSLALKELGFGSFVEAFNVIGYAMGSRPASVKNYRDEFDPLFPNRRKGWHNRPVRGYCLKVFEEYKDLDFESFTGLIRSFFGFDDNVWSEVQATEGRQESESQFVKRLITGLAAEQYFESVHAGLPEFEAYDLENTTRLGCGYDFRLRSVASAEFLAVEVKGLKQRKGNLSLTPKEYEIATVMKDRFFLFVVKNFEESPFHEIFQDPLSGTLLFRRNEKVVIQVSWLTSV
jgi:hypothetical protein